MTLHLVVEPVPVTDHWSPPNVVESIPVAENLSPSMLDVVTPFASSTLVHGSSSLVANSSSAPVTQTFFSHFSF